MGVLFFERPYFLAGWVVTDLRHMIVKDLLKEWELLIEKPLASRNTMLTSDDGNCGSGSANIEGGSLLTPPPHHNCNQVCVGNSSIWTWIGLFIANRYVAFFPIFIVHFLSFNIYLTNSLLTRFCKFIPQSAFFVFEIENVMNKFPVNLTLPPNKSWPGLASSLSRLKLLSLQTSGMYTNHARVHCQKSIV